MNSWIARKPSDANSDDAATPRPPEKVKTKKIYDAEKALMYRLRFAGNFVEQKQSTYERMERGPDERVQASREARRKLALNLAKKKEEKRKLRAAHARDRAILRELNLAKFDEARKAQGDASSFQQQYGFLSEQHDHLSRVEKQLKKKLSDMIDERTKRALANRTTPAMLQRDVDLLERLVETRQQQGSTIKTKNERRKERIDGQRLTLTLQKEKLAKMTHQRDEKKQEILKLSEEEHDTLKAIARVDLNNAAITTLIAEGVKAFKLKWKVKMAEIHLTQNKKKKAAVKDKGHAHHAKGFENLRKRASMNKLNEMQQSKKREQKKQYIDSMEEAFETITKETGIESLDELVDTFLRSEHRNFSVYKHINELNRDIEEAVAEVRVLRTDISRYSKEYTKTGVSRQRKVSTLNDDRKRLEKKVQEYQENSEGMEKLIKVIQPLLLQLFRLMGCDQVELNRELVANGVTDSNTSSVLGIMEQQAITISNLFLKLTQKPVQQKDESDKEDEEEVRLEPIDKAVEKSIKAPNPPSFGDFDPIEGESRARGSFLRVAPLDVTNLRKDVQNRIEQGKFRQRNSRRRQNIVNGPLGISEDHLKEIQAMQKKIRKSMKENDDSDDEAERAVGKKNPFQKMRRASARNVGKPDPRQTDGNSKARRVLV
jgi:hypothetical protein